MYSNGNKWCSGRFHQGKLVEGPLDKFNAIWRSSLTPLHCAPAVAGCPGTAEFIAQVSPIHRGVAGLCFIMLSVDVPLRQALQLLGWHRVVAFAPQRTNLPNETTFTGTSAAFTRFPVGRGIAVTGANMDRLVDFTAAFLDAAGTLIQTMPVQAESLTIATCRAGEIASKIEAADFYITSEPAHARRAVRLPNSS